MKLITAPKIKGLIEAPPVKATIVSPSKAERLMEYQDAIDLHLYRIRKRLAEMDELVDVEVSDVSEGDKLIGNPEGGFENQKQ